MKIAEASSHTGLSIDTLRYYEKEGLIRPTRSSGQRVYSQDDLEQLRNIARLRILGISIPEIRTLLDIDRTVGNLTSLSNDEISKVETVQEMIDRHIVRLEHTIQEMETTLSSFRKMTSKLTILLESGGLGNEP